MIKWKSNAISGLKVGFSVKMQKDRNCRFQKKIWKANNWISFLENMELMMIKRRIFFTFWSSIGYKCKKNIIYCIAIAIEIFLKNQNRNYTFSIFIYITGKIQYLQGTDHSLKVNINRFWLNFFCRVHLNL